MATLYRFAVIFTTMEAPGEVVVADDTSYPRAMNAIRNEALKLAEKGWEPRDLCVKDLLLMEIRPE